MTPQRIVAVYSVTIHASPRQPFFKGLSHESCSWLDALLNGESNDFYQKFIGSVLRISGKDNSLYEEIINHFLKACNSLSSYFVTGNTITFCS